MSRAHELFLRAARNAKRPVSRLYFDTEPMRAGGWPNANAPLTTCLELSRELGIELCVPTATLHERAEQRVREVLATVEDAKAKTKTAQKTLESFRLANGVAFQGPEESEIKERYEAMSRAAMARFQIREVPCATRSFEEVFRTAVARGGTFESKESGVVGVQDWMILLSAVDDLQARPTDAAFVSADKVFLKIPTIIPTDVSLQLIQGLGPLEKALDGAIGEVYDAEFDRLLKEIDDGISRALDSNRDVIEEFIKTQIDTSEVEKLFSGKVLSVDSLAIQRFGVIRPKIAGATTDPLQFSCDVRVAYKATVEETLYGYSTAATAPRTFAEVGIPPYTFHSVKEGTATVEVNAQVNADYSKLVLNSAQIRPSDRRKS